MNPGHSGGLSSLSIRPARPEDYEQIVEVWRASGLNIACGGRDSRESFHRQLAHLPELILVACHDQKIIGVVLGSHDYRKGWINRLAVLPEFRRCGLARALVEACEAAMRAKGIDIFAALVEPNNEASVSLFERLGYGRDIPVVYFRKTLHPEA